MTDAVTISRETLQAAIDALECALSDSRPYIVKSREVSTTLRAALAAQPAEPVARDAALKTLAQVFDNGEEAEGDDGAIMMVDLALWNEGCEALESLVSEDELAAPPAPVPPEPIAEMDAVAIKYAHKMALDLECILAEYGGSWYNAELTGRASAACEGPR